MCCILVVMPDNVFCLIDKNLMLDAHLQLVVISLFSLLVKQLITNDNCFIVIY